MNWTNMDLLGHCKKTVVPQGGSQEPSEDSKPWGRNLDGIRWRMVDVFLFSDHSLNSRTPKENPDSCAFCLNWTKIMIIIILFLLGKKPVLEKK